MAKKDETLLGLATVPMASAFGNGHAGGGLARSGAFQALTKEQQRVLAEFEKQHLVIEKQQEKTTFGEEMIGEIHEHGFSTFAHTSGAIIGIKALAQGAEHQAYLEEFSKHQLAMLARHISGAVNVGATNIAVEISRSLYPEPELPEPRSWLKRLIG